MVVVDIGAGERPQGEINIDVARTRYCNLVASTESLPFRGNCIDTIFCSQVLEHLNNPRKALSEINRVLKRGEGKAHIDFPKPSFTNNSKYRLLEFLFNLPFLPLNLRSLRILFKSLKGIKKQDPRWYHKYEISVSLIKQYLNVQTVEEFGDIFLSFLNYGKKSRYFVSFKPQINTAYKVLAKAKE